MLKETVDFIRTTYLTPEAFIPLHEPRFTGNEKKYLNECIDSTFVSSVGKFVTKFEDDIKQYIGSCTRQTTVRTDRFASGVYFIKFDNGTTTECKKIFIN